MRQIDKQKIKNVINYYEYIYNRKSLYVQQIK